MNATTPKKYVTYFILSPDGISTHPEPFNCLAEDLADDVTENFEKWKSRFTQQGYYSSNSGRIALEDLEKDCTVQIVQQES